MRLVSLGLLVTACAAGACNHVATDNQRTGQTGTDPASSSATSARRPLEDHEVTLPAGSVIPITLDTTVSSETSHVEQPVAAHITRNIVIAGRTVLIAGSPVNGVVTDAVRSGKVKGRAHVAVRFTTLTTEHSGPEYRIASNAIARTAPATKKKDAITIAAPAAGGALIGALARGKKGAAIGTAIGGGAGTAAVLSTRGDEVHLPKGTALTLTLTEPVTVRVRG